MKLKHLIKKIRDENKIPTEELIEKLVDIVYECDEEDCRKLFKDLYVTAYGEHLTRETAEEWVKEMEVTDGSGMAHGQKWTMEQTTDVGNKMGIDWGTMSKIDWYVALNMEYWKHYHTAKLFGQEAEPTFYGHLAKDEWYGSTNTMFEYYFDHVM